MSNQETVLLQMPLSRVVMSRVVVTGPVQSHHLRFLIRILTQIADDCEADERAESVGGAR